MVLVVNGGCGAGGWPANALATRIVDEIVNCQQFFEAATLGQADPQSYHCAAAVLGSRTLSPGEERKTATPRHVIRI